MQVRQREKQLKKILYVFKKENIRILVLKGLSFAWTVYPDPATRFTDDIDLLVSPDQMLKARLILEGLGYKCKVKLFEVLRHSQFEEEFLPEKNKKDKCLVELHWELHRFSGFTRDADINDLFIDIYPVPLGRLGASLER